MNKGILKIIKEIYILIKKSFIRFYILQKLITVSLKVKYKINKNFKERNQYTSDKIYLHAIWSSAVYLTGISVDSPRIPTQPYKPSSVFCTLCISNEPFPRILTLLIKKNKREFN